MTTVNEIVHKMTNYWDFEHYTVEYIMVCESASFEEGIDYFKQEGNNANKLRELVDLKTFFDSHHEEIKDKLLKYQKDKYGDIGQCAVRVQGM